MKRVLARSLQRRVALWLHRPSAGSPASAASFYTLHPEFNVAEVAWLAKDSISLRLLSEEDALRTFLCRENLTALATNGSHLMIRDTLVPQMQDHDVIEFFRAMSTLPATVREHPDVIFTIEAVSSHLVSSRRYEQWSQETAITFLKQMPSVALSHAPKTSAVMGLLIHLWVPRFGELTTTANAKSFLQTLGSQLLKFENSDQLSKLDVNALNRGLMIWLERKHSLRSLVPQALVTLSKLFEKGFPLGSFFGPGLTAYMRLFDPQRNPITLSEALRTLHCISRVRGVQQELVFVAEVQQLMEAIVFQVRSGGAENLDGVDLAMLFQCMTSNQQQHELMSAAPQKIVQKMKQAPAASSAQVVSIGDVLMSKMVPLIPTMSPRGFLSFCRAAAQAEHRSGLVRSGLLCEAVAERAAAILISPQVVNSPLLEKLTILAAGNVFYGKTPASRLRVQSLMWDLIKLHPNEVSGTEASMLISTLAWTFGVAVGCGDLAVSVGIEATPPSNNSSQMIAGSRFRELDPTLLACLIERSAAATRLSQYALSTMLRSFCRLGLTYEDVSPVARRILTLRHDPGTLSVDETHRGYVHERSVLDDFGDAVVPSERKVDPSMFARGRNKVWEERNLGAWCVLSAHMTEMVLMALDVLKCNDASVNAYVLMSLQAHNMPSSATDASKTSSLPPRLHPFVNRILERNPQVAPLVNWL